MLIAGYTWLRRLVAGLSRRRTGFDPRTVHIKFFVDKVKTWQDSSDYFGFPSTLHNHLHLHVAVTSRTNGRSLGTFKKTNVLQEIG
jgi:hypothetical protein